MTQEYRLMPPRSPTMRGRLVPTTVASRLAKSMPSVRPIMTNVLVLLFLYSMFSGGHASTRSAIFVFFLNIRSPILSKAGPRVRPVPINVVIYFTTIPHRTKPICKFRNSW